VIDAEKRGLGIGYVPINMVKDELKNGWKAYSYIKRVQSYP